ncbi:hypothetical protein [Parasporobacterium paucivorans]|uniref:Uncharacterized protein n=1 Tax=Parasporobacterium paucivorans DSM 15970 TaxID=1122934 RepID=A0A1M6B4H1_9FIRM|nr:hypothetical protein [Parasporobacterium paucivorans]SHI43596.1 hypothetical protein SAMN02745691_00257 [Parasporobacterium paucivorans DSM 15970]
MNGGRMNGATLRFLLDLVKTMEELKDDPNRDKFCVNFDEEYAKLKKKLMEES